MRTRSLTSLLYAVLIFQLAVGMHWPLAQAGSLPEPLPTTSAAAQLCPEHATRVHTPTVSSTHHVLPHQQTSQKKHDCCRSAGCQCHCTFTPASDAIDVSVALTSAYLLPALDLRAATERPDELFRPPIA